MAFSIRSLGSPAYWLERARVVPASLLAKDASNSDDLTIELDLESVLDNDFGRVAAVCREATAEVLGLLEGGGYENLARNSPGLAGYDWRAYISLSVLRLARVARALTAHLPPGARVLDFGSYFGNAALLARKLGYEVSALNSYARYAPALEREQTHMIRNGVRVLDSSLTPTLLDHLDETFEAVLLMGVIEHIPHTPKQILQHVATHLAEGGLLILDTPNLAYLYTRHALMRGESVFPDIRVQFHTELPFEGHHREYTRDEVAWMLNEVGLSVIETELFNYSIYAQTQLHGEDARRYEEMQADEIKREVIFSVASKKAM